MQLDIGCSGYYYPQWKNNFYPTTVATGQWLEQYSSVFNSVELNATFYRQPKAADLQRNYKRTPDHFSFAVKMSRYISHVMRMKGAKNTILEFQKLISDNLQEKAKYFLFQFPANFKYSEENLQDIIQNIPHSENNVLEFRNIDWWNTNVYNAMQAANLTFCNIDFPGIDSYFVQTSKSFYMRLHGNPILFKSAYSTETLEKYYKLIPKGLNNYAIYFNNTYFNAAFENAIELIKLFKNSNA